MHLPGSSSYWWDGLSIASFWNGVSRSRRACWLQGMSEWGCWMSSLVLYVHLTLFTLNWECIGCKGGWNEVDDQGCSSWHGVGLSYDHHWQCSLPGWCQLCHILPYLDMCVGLILHICYASVIISVPFIVGSLFSLICIILVVVYHTFWDG